MRAPSCGYSDEPTAVTVVSWNGHAIYIRTEPVVGSRDLRRADAPSIWLLARDEGVLWLRGWHPDDCQHFRALLAARSLTGSWS